MNGETTLVLCGGPINYSNLPVGTNQSNAMVPVNGRPVIGWILDDLLAKGIRAVTVVLREQDHRLRNFLQAAYANRMSLTIAPLAHEGSILQSLQAGMQSSPTSGLVRIALGDTLIRDSAVGGEDFVYVAEVSDSRRWCLAFTDRDGRIIDYADKQELAPGPGRLALAGYYHLLHGDHLQACVETAIEAGESELSDVLRRYGSRYPIRAKHALEWFDFGHIDNLVDARRRLLQPRYFNSLRIDPVLNTITKTSDHDKKLKDELDWYLQIPDELKVLTPRILTHDQVDGRTRIVQEHYGYPNLAELYVFADLDADTWISILRRVFRIHQEFCRHAGELEPQDLAAVYIGKTEERLEMLRRQDPAWNTLLSRETVTCNGRVLQNFGTIQQAVVEKTRELTLSAPVRVIHGDLCFSNILFDIGSQILRLIDPRGSFGKKGVLGDARYDIAKLRHSVCGLYDFVLADMFSLQEEDGEFTTRVFAGGAQRTLATSFDQMVGRAGYDLNEIRLIEGLLFVSMLPLHHGHPGRQRMMFLRGLTLLNQVIEGASSSVASSVAEPATASAR